MVVIKLKRNNFCLRSFFEIEEDDKLFRFILVTPVDISRNSNKLKLFFLCVPKNIPKKRLNHSHKILILDNNENGVWLELWLFLNFGLLQKCYLFLLETRQWHELVICAKMQNCVFLWKLFGFLIEIKDPPSPQL